MYRYTLKLENQEPKFDFELEFRDEFTTDFQAKTQNDITLGYRFRNDSCSGME